MGVMNEERLTLYDGLIKTHITNTTVAKEDGKGLSTNDYTTEEQTKLSGIEEGANKTIVDSALDSSSENPVQNKVIAGEITTLKKSVSDGKTLVATAITDKGVETAADATFAVMAENIGQIETGGGELHGATISVNTSEENPTSVTVTLSKNSTTIEQKNFDSNKTCTFTDIQEPGDYTVSATKDSFTNSVVVTITSDNIVNKSVRTTTIDFTLDGSTATPLNDVATWLRTDSTGSSLAAGYTTLNQLMEDPDTLRALMADESAMEYLARSTGFADEGCANETFMTLLGQSKHVDSTVLNSDIWVEVICSSTYFESVLNAKVPTMTSNTYPSGECFSDSVYVTGTINGQPWKAFDNDDSTSAFCNVSATQTYWHVGYELTAPLNLYKVKVTVQQSTSFRYDNYTYKIQYFDNIKNNWVDCSEEFLFTPSDSGIHTTNIVTNGIASTKFRVYGLRAKTKSYTPYEPLSVHALQFYGRSSFAS